MHKLPKDNQVKHLNLRNFQDHCDDSTKLMIACRSLEKLSLSSLDFNKGQGNIAFHYNNLAAYRTALYTCRQNEFKVYCLG